MQEAYVRSNINSSDFFKQQLLMIDNERNEDSGLRPTMKTQVIRKRQIDIKLPNSTRNQPIFTEEIVPWTRNKQSNRKL